MNISYRIRFLCAGISVVLLFLAVSAFGAAAPSARTPGRVRGRTERRYVFMKLSGPMPERLPVLYLFEPKYKTLRQVLDVLDKVRKDESVTGVMIYLGSPQIGWARAQELRTALNACKLSGKSVICFM